MKRVLATILAFVILISSSAMAAKITSPSETITQALRSVGHVKGEQKDDDDEVHHYGCSAFAVASRKFLTAAHCVGDKLTVDGIVAKEIKVDEEKDLAILLVDDTRPPLTLRDRPLSFYEVAYGLGYGYSWAHPTVTFHRALMFKYGPPDTSIYPGTWYQGGFIGGMSGGPIVDESGQVVGVVQRSNDVTGYGVDVDAVKEFLK